MSDAIERLRSLRVRDVMTRHVVLLPRTATLRQAAETLSRHQISAAPVTDAQQRCVGILSAADFLKWAAQRSVSDSETGEHVETCMTESVRSVEEDTSLLKAAIIMCSNHIHRLPVLDPDGCVVGLISTMDIVAAMLNAIDEMDISLLKQYRAQT